MEHAPHITWPLAHRVAGARPGDLPPMSVNEVERLVAHLRVTGRRAGEIAARHLRVDSLGAAHVRVVDWDGWGRAVHRMVGNATTEFALGAPKPGPLAGVRGAGNALGLGLGIRLVSRRLLGQYDTFDDTLYLVAPTILQYEQKFGFVPEHFRLWVAIHEQVHALQFVLAPWLRPYIRDRMRLLLHDEVSLGEGLRGFARTRDLSSLVASGEAGAAVSELTATMTFLEGHADYVSDNAGRRHAPTVNKMRRSFARPAQAQGLARLSAALDKNAQYRDGLEFCRGVSRLKTRSALAAAFAEPDNLPTSQEITDPSLWLARVHG